MIINLAECSQPLEDMGPHFLYSCYSGKTRVCPQVFLVPQGKMGGRRGLWTNVPFSLPPCSISNFFTNAQRALRHLQGLTSYTLCFKNDLTFQLPCSVKGSIVHRFRFIRSSHDALVRRLFFIFISVAQAISSWSLKTMFRLYIQKRTICAW